MAVLTDDTGKDYAGSGTTGVAWAGLGLSVLNTLMGGALGGGILGGNRGFGQPNQQGNVQQELAEKDAKIAQLESQMFTNSTVQSFYDRHAQETADAIASQAKVTDATIAPIAEDVKILREQNVQHNAEIACIQKTQELQQQINELKADKAISAAVTPVTAQVQQLAAAIELLKQQVSAGLSAEASARSCADTNLANYCNTVFQPKLIAGVTASDTVTNQVTFNPNGCACALANQSAATAQTVTRTTTGG